MINVPDSKPALINENNNPVINENNHPADFSDPDFSADLSDPDLSADLSDIDLSADLSDPGLSALFPADPLPAGSDRALRTYEDAEVAADALSAVQKGSPILSHGDCLVSAVRAGYGASAAANTFVAVELGENH